MTKCYPTIEINFAVITAIVNYLSKTLKLINFAFRIIQFAAMSITRAIITRRSPLTLNFNQITRLSSTQPTANSSSVKAANKTNEVDANPSILSLGTHKADSFERKMLVWTGKYKSAKDIPAYVKYLTSIGL